MTIFAGQMLLNPFVVFLLAIEHLQHLLLAHAKLGSKGVLEEVRFLVGMQNPFALLPG